MRNINSVVATDVASFRERNSAETVNALDEYQMLATRSAIYPGQGTPLGLAYVALKLNGEAGELAEHVGKAMRDDDLIHVGGSYSDATFATKFNPLTPERHNLAAKELGDMLWYIAAGARELGLSLSDIAGMNLAKLADRSARNALQGGGDNR